MGELEELLARLRALDRRLYRVERIVREMQESDKIAAAVTAALRNQGPVIRLNRLQRYVVGGFALVNVTAACIGVAASLGWL